MGSLYISTCYGYAFNGSQKPEFKKIRNEDDKEIFAGYRANKYDIDDKAKICVDEEGYVRFIKKLDNEVLCIYGGGIFPVGDQFRVSDASFSEVEKDFEQMLKDSDTPEVFRNGDNWDFVGMMFSVSS
jgi:hypothetical protein